MCNGFSFSMVSTSALQNGVPVFGSRLPIRCATESSVRRFRHYITADQLLYLAAASVALCVCETITDSCSLHFHNGRVCGRDARRNLTDGQRCAPHTEISSMMLSIVPRSKLPESQRVLYGIVAAADSSPNQQDVVSHCTTCL